MFSILQCFRSRIISFISPSFHRMIDGCRSVLNNLLPDVFIYTDHMTSQLNTSRKRVRDYGIILNAETTSGCSISSYSDFDSEVDYKVPMEENQEMVSEGIDDREKEIVDGRNMKNAVNDNMLSDSHIIPEALGASAARRLLEEIERGGTVDTTHQSLLIVIAAAGPCELHRFRYFPLHDDVTYVKNNLTSVINDEEMVESRAKKCLSRLLWTFSLICL